MVLYAAWTFVAGQSRQGTPFLERTITISFNNERLDAALTRISQQAGFTFSYNPAIIETEKVVTYNFVNKTVREILDQLFNGTLQYKVRGKYIILTRIEQSSKDIKVYSGYVIDEATGERLKNVSIYDPVTLSSTVTDTYGYFEIEIPKPDRDLRLAINKQNYADTLIIPPDQGKLLNIPLKINRDKINTLADSVNEKLKRFWQRTKLYTKQQINMANINDTLHRKTQVSFVPFIGTNHALSGNVINDYSFNIIGGYSYGVEKFELGGVFNIDRGNVNGAQLAGSFNAVGGNVNGAQIAGVFNANQGNLDGAQLAGVFNFNWGTTQHFSGAGVFNFSRLDSRAVQLAGVYNLTLAEQKRPQLTGVFNFAGKNAQTQVAGVYNFAGGDVKGLQGAGVINFSGKSVKGVQASGVINFAAKEIQGAQLSGVLNFASKVRGAQIGLFNVADSLKGIPIGLLSIVMKGYHKIEVSADEVFYNNVAFRTGVQHFYNIITVGAQPSTYADTTTLWTFGYGLGTAPKIARKLYLNVDLTSNQIVQGNSIDALNLLNKAYVGVDFQFLKKMSLAVGATLNIHVTESDYEGYWNIFKDYRPEMLYEQSHSNNFTTRMWIGGKIGLRFL